MALGLATAIGIGAPLLGGIGEMIGGWLGNDKYNDYAQQAQQGIQSAVSQGQNYLQPYSGAGSDSMSEYMARAKAGPGEFFESPEYLEQKRQVTDATTNEFAANRTLQSGNYLNAFQDRLSNVARLGYQNFLGNYYNSLKPFQWGAQQGQQAATNQANIGMQGALGVAGSLQGQGNAGQQMYQNMGSSFNTMLGGAGNNYLAAPMYDASTDYLKSMTRNNNASTLNSQPSQTNFGYMPGLYNG